MSDDSLALPFNHDCPNCGRPLTTHVRFAGESPAPVSVTCDSCGVVGPIKTVRREPLVVELSDLVENAA